MRVLITGHRGYIGSVAAPLVAAAGHEVVGADSGLYDECGFEPAEHDAPRVDVRDIDAAALRGVDAIIHLAALCNDPLGDLSPALTDDINRRGSVRLATLARDVGVRRFIFASSCSMYGAANNEQLLTENAPLRPLTPYAESKVRVEEALQQLADNDFSPVYLRNATAYGASPRLRGDVVVNNLVGWAHTTGRLRLMSDGSAWRPLVHVEDIARACVACLEAPRSVIHNQAFNVGVNEENYRIRQVAEIVRAAVPGATVEYAPGGGADPRDYRVDFSKIRTQLPGFRPAWTVATGAGQVLEAFRRHRTTHDAFTSWRFNRLAHIQRLREAAAVTGDLRWTGAAASTPVSAMSGA